MRGFVCTALVLGIFTSAASEEDRPSGGTDIAKIAGFLREHVAGKTLRTEITDKIDNGKIEAVFSRRTTLTNVLESPNVLVFDDIAVIEQTNYDLDKDGQRQMPGHKKDRTLVSRYEIRKSKSTGRVIGNVRIISSSFDEFIGSISSVKVKVEDNTLTLDETAVGYQDFFTQGDKYKPGVDETRVVFSLVGGKVRRTDDSTSYDVDPETMTRTNMIKYGTLVSKEED